MNDDQRLLASAALDGALTSEEQARVDVDPEVVAEIERLRGVRAALQVDVAPDAARRDAAIAAALAAFDRAPAPPPVSLAARRRSRWMAPVAAVAAAAVIAVGGVVALRGGGSDNDDAASDAAASELSGAVAREESAAATVAPDDADAAAPALPAPAGEVGGSADTAAAAEATDLGESAVLDTAEMPTLRTPDDFAAFATATAGGDGFDAAVCREGTLHGLAFYVVDGAKVGVEVFVTADPHEVIAVAIDGCDVVARAPLP